MASKPVIFGILFLANVICSTFSNATVCTTLASGDLFKKTTEILQSNSTCKPSIGLCYHYSRQIENNSRTVEHFGCYQQLNTTRFSELRQLIQAIPSSETELCSIRQDNSKICVCRASNKSDLPCNAKWVEQCRYRGIIPTDWVWLLGTVALWTTGLIGCIGCILFRKDIVMEVQDKSHVYIAKPVSIGWRFFHGSILLVQAIQLLSCFVHIVILWNPIFVDCPIGNPPERYEPEFVAPFQLINNSASLRNVSFTSWFQPISVQLMMVKIECFLTIIFVVYLIWQIVFFKSIIYRRHFLSGLVLSCMHCLYSIILALISCTNPRQIFEIILDQGCAKNDEQTRLTVFQINHYIFMSFSTIELAQLILFNIKFWDVFFNKQKKETTKEKSESENTEQSICTAISLHSEIINDLMIEPMPFVVTRNNNGDKIWLFNGYSDQWLAVRLLTRIPGIYIITPDRINIPPKRQITVIVQRGQVVLTHQAECSILAEFFPVDDDFIFTRGQSMWQRPYIVPREKWKHKLIVVLYQLETN